MAKLVVQDSWLAYNPYWGCNANCVYCFQKPKNKTAIKVKKDYQEIEKEYENVISYYEKYYGKNKTENKIPIAIGTESDMFQTVQFSFLLKFLDIHKQRKSTIPIALITKQCIPEEIATRYKDAGFNIFIFLSASLLPEGYEPGNPTLERRLQAAKKIREIITEQEVTNIKLVHNWRPFIATDALMEKEKFVKTISNIFDCSILIGIRITNAMYKQIIQDENNLLYGLVKSYYDKDETFFEHDAKEILDNSLQEIFGEIAPEYPAFRNTSCAISYVLQQPDYTGTMWREDICPETICPLTCQKRCKQFKNQWDDRMLSCIKEQYKDRGDCIELLVDVGYEQTIVYTHITGKPVYVPQQYQKLEWFCGNYRYYNKKYCREIKE